MESALNYNIILLIMQQLGLINRSINFHATMQETTLGGLRTNVYDRQSEEREPQR